LDLLKKENQLNTISKNAKKMGKPNASDDIVKEIFKLIS
jgi:UDP-N-acetylglucosamine:LPS N-acetylglucosamine transferase